MTEDSQKNRAEKEASNKTGKTDMILICNLRYREKVVNAKTFQSFKNITFQSINLEKKI